MESESIFVLDAFYYNWKFIMGFAKVEVINLATCFLYVSELPDMMVAK